jgi:copper chaperone CopZ
MAYNLLSKESLTTITPLVDRVNIEVSKASFTPDEAKILESCYTEITGMKPGKNCSGCFKTVIRSLRNYFAANPIHNVLTERILEPSKENVFDEMSVSEIKSALKLKGIEFKGNASKVKLLELLSNG